MPGSEELADETVAALGEHRIVLWQMHGCVAIGRDAVDAFDLIDTVSKAAAIYLLCRSAGHEPEGLGDAALEELRRTYGRGGAAST